MSEKKGITRIDALTEEQAAQMPAWAEKWVKIGLCTDPVERPKAEEALRRCYTFAGLAQPDIKWAANPTELAQMVGDSVWASVWDSVGDSVRASVRDSVRDSVRASVWASVWDSVGDSVRASVRDSVRDSVRASVWASVRDSVRASVWDSVRDSVRDLVREAYDGGQTWVEWPAMEAFLREVCGLDLGEMSERGKALADLRSSCGPILMFQGMAICMERPLSFTPLTWRETSMTVRVEDVNFRQILLQKFMDRCLFMQQSHNDLQKWQKCGDSWLLVPSPGSLPMASMTMRPCPAGPNETELRIELLIRVATDKEFQYTDLTNANLTTFYRCLEAQALGNLEKEVDEVLNQLFGIATSRKIP